MSVSGAWHREILAGKSALARDCRQAAPGLYLARIYLDGKEIGTAKVAVVR